MLITEIQAIVLFISFTIGSILRTLWGWLWKYLENPEMEWKHRYTLSMVVSVVVTFIFSITTFSTLDLTMEWNPMIAFTFITTGFTINSLFNDMLSHYFKVD